MKKLILLFVSLFLVFGCATFAITKAKTNDVSNQAQLEKGAKTIVYYFWSKPRCRSCKKIEAYTKESVEENFSSELKNGSVEFKVVDYTKDKAKQKKYGLYTKSVILSQVENGKEIKYKNLDKVWIKLNNKDNFKKYIKTEVQDFIK